MIASDKKDDQDILLTRKQAAAYLSSIGCPISARTLANLASNNNEGKGPSFQRTRWKIIRYRKSDLEAWARKETVIVA